MTGTRPGCKALAECAAYGSAKDRKKMIKTLKVCMFTYLPPYLHTYDLLPLRASHSCLSLSMHHQQGYVVPTLLHKDAYLVILRLADVVDDTVTFSKIIWNELLEKNESEATMLRFATHVKASKVLLNLLAPTKRTTFLTKVCMYVCSMMMMVMIGYRIWIDLMCVCMLMYVYIPIG